MKKLRFLFLVLVAVSFTGCVTYDDVEFKGWSDFKFGGLKGKDVDLSFNASIYNPNKYTIKAKPSNFDLYVEDSYVGKAFLTEKVTMKKKSTSESPVKLRIELIDGAMFSLIRLIKKDEIEIMLEGKLKGSVYGLNKKFDVKEKKTISTKDFNLKGLMGML